MSNVLDLCRESPVRELSAGEILIEENEHNDTLFVLIEGACEVVRNGVRVAEVDRAGALLGEISIVLSTPASARVIATRDSRIHVIEHAAHVVRNNPELLLAIARLLARRLTALTAYVVDIKKQYADSGTHLGVMDQVLSSLIVLQPSDEPFGSERDDTPNY
jgi:CRP/FNR family cyclic AMP-dependent transcriptional regulator